MWKAILSLCLLLVWPAHVHAVWFHLGFRALWLDLADLTGLDPLGAYEFKVTLRLT
jgi:hypothetical protein